MALSLTLYMGEDDDWRLAYEEPTPASLGMGGELYYPAELIRLSKCEHCQETYISPAALKAHECPNPPPKEDDEYADRFRA